MFSFVRNQHLVRHLQVLFLRSTFKPLHLNLLKKPITLWCYKCDRKWGIIFSKIGSKMQYNEHISNKTYNFINGNTPVFNTIFIRTVLLLFLKTTLTNTTFHDRNVFNVVLCFFIFIWNSETGVFVERNDYREGIETY